MKAIQTIAALPLLAAACNDRNQQEPELWTWSLPSYLEPSPAMAGVTVAEVELGRRLFFDPRLSATGEMSCASCHQPDKAFANNEQAHAGVFGDRGFKNTPSLGNLAYAQFFTWANTRINSLHQLAMVPLFGTSPVELGAQLSDVDIPEALSRDPQLAPMIVEIYGDGELNWDRIRACLEAYQHTLVLADSPYDSFLAGDETALNKQQTRGLELFKSAELGCSGCHGGPFLSNNFVAPGVFSNELGIAGIFFNIGLYNSANYAMSYVSGEPAYYPEGHAGLGEFTLDHSDDGKFRVPSLRNVAITAPYMHDGSISSLRDVIALYQRGGRILRESGQPEDGRDNPNKSPVLDGFALSVDDEEALLSFLNALTDREFVEAQR